MSTPQQVTQNPHAEPGDAKGPPSGNPLQSPFNVFVSVPKKITIKMVDASALGDYEVWVFLSSILSNAFVGFLVAYFQAVDAGSKTENYILATSIIFGLLMGVCLWTAYRKRNQLSTSPDNIDLEVTRTSSNSRGP